MGTDIHVKGERLVNGKWVQVNLKVWDPKKNEIRWPGLLQTRNYRVFTLLAGIRNLDWIPTISNIRGMPRDVSQSVKWWFENNDYNIHSVSWLTIQEIHQFDYSQKVTQDAARKTLAPLHTMLPESFFKDLNTLTSMGVDRIIFGFDN